MSKIFGFILLAGITFACISANKQDNQQSESGIFFDHHSLADAKAMAKKLKKPIFIDAYASWCGPCKIMAATSFKDAKVGELYNQKFINLKIDVEKDADGPEIARMYKIEGYPSLLFINSDGKLLKSALGMQNVEQLIVLANSVK